MHAPVALVLLACVVVSATAFLRPSKNVYSSIAAKFGVTAKPVEEQQEHGKAVTAFQGYLIASSYLNNNECAGQPYAVEWITIGYCGIYHANATDPAAPDPGCGSFVSTTVTQTALTGDFQYILSYNFYKDSACTIPGEATNGTCTRSVAINSTCTDDSSDGVISSVAAEITYHFSPPEEGYTQMYVISFRCVIIAILCALPCVAFGWLPRSHNSSGCSDTPYSGLWQAVGCNALSDTLSLFGSCSGTRMTSSELSFQD